MYGLRLQSGLNSHVNVLIHRTERHSDSGEGHLTIRVSFQKRKIVGGIIGIANLLIVFRMLYRNGWQLVID